jgi:hypothetical protein
VIREVRRDQKVGDVDSGDNSTRSVDAKRRCCNLSLAQSLDIKFLAGNAKAKNAGDARAKNPRLHGWGFF